MESVDKIKKKQIIMHALFFHIYYKIIFKKQKNEKNKNKQKKRKNKKSQVQIYVDVY